MSINDLGQSAGNNFDGWEHDVKTLTLATTVRVGPYDLITSSSSNSHLEKSEKSCHKMRELLEITRNHNLHILGLLHFTGSLGSSTSAPSTTLEFLYILSN